MRATDEETLRELWDDLDPADKLEFCSASERTRIAESFFDAAIDRGKDTTPEMLDRHIEGDESAMENAFERYCQKHESFGCDDE